MSTWRTRSISPAERLDADAGGADAARVRVLAVVRLEHRRDDRLEDLRLVLVVPDVLEDEEVARVGLRAAVEVRARGEELEELHDAPVAEAHALGADLEDEALVLREELLAEARPLQRARAAARRARAPTTSGCTGASVICMTSCSRPFVEQILEVVRVEVVVADAEDEAVVDRRERLVASGTSFEAPKALRQRAA